MPAVQPKTKDIISKLSPSLAEGRLLFDDIEKQKMLRDVRRLPERYQALAIEGIIVLLDGQLERGIQSIEESLAIYPTDPVTWGNYFSALNKLGLYSKQRDLLVRSAPYDFPNMASFAFRYGAFWADEEILKMGYSKLEKYKKINDVKDSAFFDTLRIINSLEEEQSYALGNVAKVIMEVAENEPIKLHGSSILTDGEGCVSFSATIATDDYSYLSGLNDKVVERMIHKGLEMGSCVAFFEAQD